MGHMNLRSFERDRSTPAHLAAGDAYVTPPERFRSVPILLLLFAVKTQPAALSNS